jgi:hypothetical protein
VIRVERFDKSSLFPFQQKEENLGSNLCEDVKDVDLKRMQSINLPDKPLSFHLSSNKLSHLKLTTKVSSL